MIEGVISEICFNSDVMENRRQKMRNLLAKRGHKILWMALYQFGRHFTNKVEAIMTITYA